VLIGEEVFRGLFNKEQRFVLGRALEGLRPGFVSASVLEPSAFLPFYEALFSLGGAPSPLLSAGDEALSAGVARWEERLRGALSQEDVAQLRGLVRRCLARWPERRPSMLDWQRAVQASALRVGIFLAGDPILVLKRLLREDERLKNPSIRSVEELSGAMEVSRDVREAVLFLLGEDFLRARRVLRGEEVLPDPEPEQGMEPEAEPEPELEVEPEAEPEVEPEAELEPEPEAELEPEPEAEPEAELEVEPEPEAGEAGGEGAKEEERADGRATAEADEAGV
jgi:hypothetical protein